MPSRKTLLTPIHTLLSTLRNDPNDPQNPKLTPPQTFTINPPPQIHEHGLPLFAPFIGRTFTGQDGVSRYFDLLNDHLEFRDVWFEDDESWIVDGDEDEDGSSMAVFLRGTCRFVWKATGQSWEEMFCYRVVVAEEVGAADAGGAAKTTGESEEGRVLKVQAYEVWADTGALYLASIGKLGEASGTAGGGGGGNELKGKGVFGESGFVTGETRKGVNRRLSGCGEVVGSGMDIYGSCGGSG